jgi:cytochrome P450
MTQRVNLMSPEVRANPYPAYARLRHDAPVAQVEPGGLWAVSRYEDILHVLKNPKRFSSSGFRVAAVPPWLGGHNPLADSLLFLDEPKPHARLRDLVSRAFQPAGLAQLEPGLRATAEALTTQVLSRGTVDFVEDFALPMSASAIGGLLGLDPALHAHFKRWADDQVAISASQPGDTELMARCLRTVEEMEKYLGGVIAQRRESPSTDLVTGLIQARPEGGALTHTEILGFLFVLLVAGLDTTMHLMGHAVRLLAERPEVLARLRADPALIPSFIEEVLRFEPPAHGVMRLCMEETTLAGVTLPPGSLLLLLLGSALRDEGYCRDGEHFDIDRRETHTMGFGHGIHFCLGAPLARLEARVALETLLPRCERLILPPAPPPWNFSLTVRGVRHLPLEIHPSRD